MPLNKEDVQVGKGYRIIFNSPVPNRPMKILGTYLRSKIKWGVFWYIFQGEDRKTAIDYKRIVSIEEL